MSTDPKESCSRDLSEFDDRNEILTVKYLDSESEALKPSTRVSSLITEGFESEEDLESVSEPPTPLKITVDHKICYSKLLELRRQDYSNSEKKSSSESQSSDNSPFKELDTEDHECEPSSIFKSLSVTLPPTDKCGTRRLLSDIVGDGSFESMNFLYGKKRLTVFSEISSKGDDLTDEEDEDFSVEEIANLDLKKRTNSLFTTTTTSNLSEVAD